MLMMKDDLDEDVNESIQHYARKKRESTNSMGIILAIAIIIIVVVSTVYLLKLY